MYNVWYIFNLKYISRITAQQTQDKKEEEYYFAPP